METPDQERAYLADAKAGRRIASEMSIHVAEKEYSAHCNHYWRTIICVDDSDVCECAICGRQIVTACNFDNEYD